MCVCVLMYACVAICNRLHGISQSATLTCHAHTHTYICTVYLRTHTYSGDKVAEQGSNALNPLLIMENAQKAAHPSMLQTDISMHESNLTVRAQTKMTPKWGHAHQEYRLATNTCIQTHIGKHKHEHFYSSM